MLFQNLLYAFALRLFTLLPALLSALLPALLDTGLAALFHGPSFDGFFGCEDHLRHSVNGE